MFFKSAEDSKYYSTNNPLTTKMISDKLVVLMEEAISNGYSCVVFLCIGTDRSTGDSFGPLVGHKIKSIRAKNVHVYGTLNDPVHAKNLDISVKMVTSTHEKPFIIAVDACLGSLDHVGCIGVDKGSIKPGSGVNKNLQSVGDMYITGIVNIGGFMDFFILQNTRLSLVMKMADVVSSSIRMAVMRMQSKGKISV